MSKQYTITQYQFDNIIRPLREGAYIRKEKTRNKWIAQFSNGEIKKVDVKSFSNILKKYPSLFKVDEGVYTPHFRLTELGEEIFFKITSK